MAHTATHHATVRDNTTHQNKVTGWVGWIGFAGSLLWLAGFFHLMAGFVALFKDDLYVATSHNAWIFDYSQWGWIHIVGGILAIFAGMSLLRGGLFGRLFAAIFVMLSAIANMAFVPIYPIWSIIIITVDVLILWAVTAHGDEAAYITEG